MPATLHSKKSMTHEEKEAAFMRLFGGVGADRSDMAAKDSFSKPANFDAMPSEPQKNEFADAPLPVQHRPDPKLMDDNTADYKPHHPLTAQRAGAGVSVSSKEEAFVRMFDHPTKNYAQAEPVPVDMEKLPSQYTEQKWEETADKAATRGIDELKDSLAPSTEPREHWLPKKMEKKLSKRGEAMHEGFMKLYQEPTHAEQ